MLFLNLACQSTATGTGASGPVRTPTPRPTPSPKAVQLTITDVSASFDQATYSTSYEIDIDAFNPGPPALSVSWTLSLTLVDPAGAPDPATPGSGAAVDVGCNNKGVGVANPYVDARAPRTQVSTFIWTHPDRQLPDGSLSGYNCDHTLMGPRGHQGLITVTVTDARWTCTASYRGTRTGFGKNAGQPGPATCRKV